MSEILSPDLLSSRRDLAEVVFEDPYGKFYEEGYKILEKWIIGESYQEIKDKLKADDGPCGEVTLAEREVIFQQGQANYDTFDFDRQNIPGTWQLTNNKGQMIFVPITPANHLLLAHSDPDAAAGLFRRIPALEELRVKFDLAVEEGIIPVAAATPTILTAAEDSTMWAESDNTKLAATLGCLGCLAGLIYLADVPARAIKKLKEKIEKFKS